MNSSGIYKQLILFLLISGAGWLIDVLVFISLIYLFDSSVLLTNMISAVPAITFVFFISTRNTFKNKKGLLKLKNKYVIYFIYQILLLISVSWVGEILYKELLEYDSFVIVENFLKIIVKFIITPITMLLNFVVMKILIEKI